MNERQYQYVLHILHSIRQGTQILEYLSGGAGVGKSTTINAIVQVLTRYYQSLPGSQLDDLFVLLCGPTGISAFNIGGITLHSALILPFNQQGNPGYNNKDLRCLSEDRRTELASRLCSVKLMICDELSMVSNLQLLYMHERLCQILRTTQPFGGCSLIFVGDLWQLPPIGGGFIFAPLKNSISSLAGTSIWDKFKLYELTEIMRQQGDPGFAIALHNMKTGQMTMEDIQLLKSREISDSNKPPDGIPWLFFRRADVKAHNMAAIAKVESSGWVSVAKDSVEGSENCTSTLKDNALRAAQGLDYQDAQGLSYEIVLKLGIRYMITTNIPTGDGLTNGAIGILKHVTMKRSSSHDNIPLTIWLSFENKTIGSKARAEIPHLPEGVDPAWTPLNRIVKSIVNWDGRNVRVVRDQFPVVAAEGITIHKSQSLTFEQVVVSVHKGISRSLRYVACSRARSAAGLWINGTFTPPRPVPLTDQVYKAYEELRARPVLLSHLPPSTNKQGMSTLYFHNIEHIRPHFHELQKVISVLQPNMIALVETYSLIGQDWTIPDYTETSRSNYDQTHKFLSYGISCYSRSRQIQATTKIYRRAFGKGHVELVVTQQHDITLVFGYKSPEATIDDLVCVLREIEDEIRLIPPQTLIVGDFNMDLNKDPDNQVTSFLKSIGFSSCLPRVCATTRAGSQIDVVFSGIRGISVHVSESLYSHHDPLIISWPEVQNITQTIKDLSIDDEPEDMEQD